MASKSVKTAVFHAGTSRYNRSFTRIEELEGSQQRPKRASTFQSNTTVPLGIRVDCDGPISPDAFETHSTDDELTEPARTSLDLDDLPIEVINMIDKYRFLALRCNLPSTNQCLLTLSFLVRNDSFIDSLSAKVNPAPPNMINLSRRFQDFYEQVVPRINAHINTLAAGQQPRDFSPAPSHSSIMSAASLFRSKAASLYSKDHSSSLSIESEQQMLTAEEFTDRKRQRRVLETKRSQLEEAMERKLCETIYDKIYRHYSTQDEAQDAKLRSKTAALDVLGIGPLELGVNIDDIDGERASRKVGEVRVHLESARRELVLMSEKRYPLAKLQHLRSCHKEIVNTLACFHPSSSADEIMPMLIYTLVTLSPENLHVISDLRFVQRFRWELKLMGEFAYCLTNLEAAISFLETVDLSALRANKSLSRLQDTSPPKTEMPSPLSNQNELALGVLQGSNSSISVKATNDATLASKSHISELRASMPLRNRQLSNLVHTPVQAIGAASETIISTADQGIKNVSTSLGESYMFLLSKFGRVSNTLGDTAPIPIPQTLEDARKLFRTPPPDDGGDELITDHGIDDQSLSVKSKSLTTVENQMLVLVAGKKAIHDQNVESVRSISSTSNKSTFLAEGSDKYSEVDIAGLSAPNTGFSGSISSIASSLNPVARFGAGINIIRGLGRSTSTSTRPAMTVDAHLQDITSKASPTRNVIRRDLVSVCCLQAFLYYFDYANPAGSSDIAGPDSGSAS